MIRVGEVQVEAMSGSVRIFCDYELDGTTERLWFEVQENMAPHVSAECGDSFFVVLVLLAHARGEDIAFVTPVSTRLHDGVTEMLLPGLQLVMPGTKVIRVHAATQDFSYLPTATGTALSLGVDSFHAVAASLAGPYPITHLTLFNNGAFGDGDAARALFSRAAVEVARAAKDMNLPLVLVDSNMAEVLRTSFVSTHSLRNLACVLLLPRLFRKFYYASGYPVTEFRLDADLDATHYDLLTAKAIATESLEVMIAGLYDRRLDKLVTISAFPPALKFLNVCILAESNPFVNLTDKGVSNCTRCYKCVKTTTALDSLDFLHLYSDVFDLDDYRRNRNRHLGRVLYDAKKLKSTHAVEVLELCGSQRGSLGVPVYWHAFQRGFRNLWRKFRS